MVETMLEGGKAKNSVASAQAKAAESGFRSIRSGTNSISDPNHSGGLLSRERGWKRVQKYTG